MSKTGRGCFSFFRKSKKIKKHEFLHSESITSVLPLGNDLVACSTRQGIFIWNIQSKKSVRYIAVENHKINGLALMNDFLVSVSDEGEIYLLDYKKPVVGPVARYAEPAKINCVTTLERFVITGLEDGNIHVRDTKTIGDHQILSGHTAPITSLGILHNNWIVSASKDKTIRIWDMGTFECVKVLEEGHAAAINTLAISGNYIISGSDDKTIRIWEGNHPFDFDKSKSEQKKLGKEVTSVALVNDKIIAGAQDGTLFVCDKRDNKINIAQVIEEHIACVTGIASLVNKESDQEDGCATISLDGYLRVWPNNCLNLENVMDADVGTTYKLAV